MAAFRKPVRALAVAAAAFLGPMATLALAQPLPQPNVAVPTYPGYPGGLLPPPTFDGCYGIVQNLYGPYHMDFCLTQFGGGTYQVYGGGLNCQGSLNWSMWPNQATIQLNYTNCNRATSWSADVMSCVLVYAPQPYLGPGVDPRVAIPTPTPVNGLQCTYQPSVPGYPPMTVQAQRRYY